MLGVGNYWKGVASHLRFVANLFQMNERQNRKEVAMIPP